MLATRCVLSSKPLNSGHHLELRGRTRPSRLACRAVAPQLQQRESAGPSKTLAPPQLLPAATIAVGFMAAELLQPGAALGALTAEEAHNMYLMSAGVGATGAVLTLLAISRFIMSFFPRLVLKAHRRRYPWALLTMCDPMLRPLQRGLFRMEPGDLDYGAVVLLALVSSVLEVLVGEGGLWVERIPDLALLHSLQYLVFFQHGLLLPTWTLVVLRAFCIL